MADVFRVGLIGCGVVGGGVVELLRDEGGEIARKTGQRLEIVRVADKDPRQARSVGVPEDRITTNAADVINDPGIQAAIELVGGTSVAKDFVLSALKAGKHVVTANKALLAKFGREIYRTARENGRCVAFEASCAGGIPLILALRNGLIANRVTAIYGILNGTCNYILSEMAQKNRSYADALAEAQRLGYAELDPTLDVNGTDTAHKLAILASIAFCADVNFDKLHIEGIQNLDAQDLAAGRELGYVCKLLGIAHLSDGGLSLRVHPAFVKQSHPLASNSGSFNAISVYANWVGHTLYYGRGAGRRPTASAVVADLVDLAVGNQARTFECFRMLNDVAPGPKYVPMDELESRYYVRLMVVDQPGVMAQITRVFGEHRISLRAMTQHESPARPDDEVVPVMVLTHNAREGGMSKALSEIANLGVVKAPPVRIRLVEEHAE
ncbi:MAG TPA: homoserine dehydrogenase [Phycisphaerae bacterium]|nr:homoserine dehydrogenase [Phycisphaerae bacterium]